MGFDTSSIQGMSLCLNVMNTVLGAVATILLVTVSSSFSNNESTARSMPFMIVTDSFMVADSLVGGSFCVNIGLKTACISYCDSEECLSQSGVPSFTYSSMDDLCPLPVPDTASAAEKQTALDTCTTLQQCDTGMYMACAVRFLV